MKYFSCFSGIEAASVAWKPLGWEAVGFSEIEPFPSAVLAHHFPNTKNYGDITKYNEWGIEPGTVDLIVGGSPCQAFSTAGLRKGLADPRGNLALVFLGLVDRLRPRWVVWENVPGVLSSNRGNDFASFVSALGQLGYGWSYRVLDAQHFGVPQRRRRVFLVASSTGDWRPCAEVLSLAEGLRGYIEEGGKEGKVSSSDAGEGSKRNSGPWWNGEDRIPALTTKNADGDQRMPDKSTFGGLIVPRPVIIDRAAFNQGVNAQYDPHIEEGDVMDSLVARGPHAVGIPPLMFKIRGGSPVETGEQGGTPGKKAGKGFLGSEDKAFTIATSQDQWLAQQVNENPVYPINTMVMGGRPDPKNDARMTLGIGDDGDPQFTLQSSHSHAVAVRTAQTSANGIGVANDISHTLDRTQGQAVQASPGMAVRRLTPVECERLQGFPDNWTRISWKGAPEEDCPDGPRYKACGNSMAVPCMAWIGKRIAEYETRHNVEA